MITDKMRMMVHADTIDRLGWDIVFRIWQDGTPEVMPNVYSPSVMCNGGTVEYLDSGWFTVSDGMSNQHGYSGPILHDSEHFTSGMLESIMAEYDHREHYFTQIMAMYDDGDIEGWIVVAKKVTV